jgi:hypothetical protein
MRGRTRGGWVTFLVCLAMSVAGLDIVAWLVRQDTTSRQAAARERANRDVAELVASARGEVAQGRFDRALARLHEAVGVEDATKLSEAEELLGHARQARAVAVGQSVEAALTGGDPAGAANLLRRYLSGPDVVGADEFAALLHDIETAGSNSRARAVLHDASDGELARLAAGGLWRGRGAVGRASLRVVQADTLRRHLPAEQARRARERAERAAAQAARERAAAERDRQLRLAREGRFRRTPLFRELHEFVDLARAACRNRPESRDADPEWLASLLGSFDVNDPAARDRALAAIDRRRRAATAEEREPPAALALLRDIARQRARFKERLRVCYREFDAADWPSLDRLIDRELDQLTAEVRGALGP